jgi:lysophospholipase L1-like esterase
MKRILNYTFFGLAVLLTLSQLCYSQKSQKTELWLKNNASVCYIGNSITQVGDYHFFIDLYYHTRYPKLSYQSYNCGIMGNTAQSLLDRMDSDILIHKPTVSTLMIGMNDVNMGLYSPNNKEPDLQKKKFDAIETYKQNVQRVVDTLVKNNSKIVFLTPSIYDQTAVLPEENMFGVNDALGTCGSFIKELAVKYKMPVVDFNTKMNEINLREQRKNPVFTIVGPDRIHPDVFGNLIMAHIFLTTMKADPMVSLNTIDVKNKSNSTQTNCTIKNLKIHENNVQFSCLENALPFPVIDKAKPALDLVPFTKDLNQELFFCKNLTAGNYQLTIDKEPIDTFSDSQLNTGINLASYSNTPQYKQSMKAMVLAWERHRLYSDIFRILEWMETCELKNLPRPIDLVQAKKVLYDNLDKMKPGEGRDWFKSIYDNYLKYKPIEKETNNRLNEMMMEYIRLVQPVAHVFKLQKVQTLEK